MHTNIQSWIFIFIFIFCLASDCQLHNDSSNNIYRQDFLKKLKGVKGFVQRPNHHLTWKSTKREGTNRVLKDSSTIPHDLKLDRRSHFGKDLRSIRSAKFMGEDFRSHSNSRHPNSEGRVSLSGSSSSPVQPIQPLLKMGSSSSGALALPPNPIIDEATPRNVTAMQDNTAYLHCLVHNLGNKSVSWIRQRDLHILTVDRYTYTTDQRYEVIHSEASNDWILKIKYAQVRDSGKYECQVSTKPIGSFTVTLNVYAAPKAEIIGAPDMHVDRGSTINLTCVIEHSPQPPAYIFWYHNGKVINYDSPRGGITVVTERRNNTRGYLLIQDARSSDSGNYSCEPSNTGIASLRVHVLDGEFPAAMQTSSVNAPTTYLPSTGVFFVCQISIIFRLLHNDISQLRTKT